MKCINRIQPCPAHTMTIREPRKHGKLTGIHNDPRGMTLTGSIKADFVLWIVSLLGLCASVGVLVVY